MRVPFLGGKASTFGNRLKVTKELRSVEFSSLLTGEQVVRAILRPLTQPSPECSRLVKQRLPAMLVQRLYGVERAFEPPNRDGTSLQVDIGQLDSTDLGRSEAVPI